jgi:hypothetical protein
MRRRTFAAEQRGSEFWVQGEAAEKTQLDVSRLGIA